MDVLGLRVVCLEVFSGGFACCDGHVVDLDVLRVYKEPGLGASGEGSGSLFFGAAIDVWICFSLNNALRMARRC